MTVVQERPATAGAGALLSAPDLAAVTMTVQNNNAGMSAEVARRITVQALAFVAACAKYPGERLRPSRIVDEGWHALILHTKIYAHLCRRLGGRFVHHVPEPPDASRHSGAALAHAQDVIKKAGFDVDAELWLPPTDTTIPVAAGCEHTEPPPDGCQGQPDEGPSGPN